MSLLARGSKGNWELLASILVVGKRIPKHSDFVLVFGNHLLGCANKDLDGYLGPLGKFIEYCRITALLPIIPLGIRNNW